MPSKAVFTDLDIVNQTLTGMGEDILQDLQTDESTAAIVMRQHYVAVKEFCLTMTAWRFATVKKALGLVADAPLNRWSGAWQLPADLLKLLYTWPPVLYEVQGQRLYINARSAVEIDYIRVIEEAYWQPWFVRLVVAELTIRTCRGITGDAPDQAMKDERNAAQADAFFQDAQQQPNQVILPNDFIDVRA